MGHTHFLLHTPFLMVILIYIIAGALKLVYTKLEQLDSISINDGAKGKSTIYDVVLRKTDILTPKSQAKISKDGSITSMPLEDLSPLLSLNDLDEVLVGEVSEASVRARS